MICKRMQSICERRPRWQWGERDPEPTCRRSPGALGTKAERGGWSAPPAGRTRRWPGYPEGLAKGVRGGAAAEGGAPASPSRSRHRGSGSSDAVGLRLLRGGCVRCAQLARPPGARPARGGGAQLGVRPAPGCPAPHALATRWDSSARSHSTAPLSCIRTGVPRAAWRS
jgi:hypothetical protein